MCFFMKMFFLNFLGHLRLLCNIIIVICRLLKKSVLCVCNPLVEHEIKKLTITL